jgi:prepilin-type N-terminal cleavage/methylation domain-containing protein
MRANLKQGGQKDQHGFTITEVSIATTVFSVILLVALASFFGVSKLFYKGLSITKTQEVASNILADVQGDFKNAAGVTALQNQNGYSYYCVGNVRYTINVGYKVDLNAPANHNAPSSDPSVPGGNFGILKDSLGGKGCAAPCSDTGTPVCGSNTIRFNSPIELLGQNMRVQQLNISPITGTNTFNVALITAYGDDDLFDYKTSGDPSTIFCKTGVADEYCSVISVSTSVVKEGS